MEFIKKNAFSSQVEFVWSMLTSDFALDINRNCVYNIFGTLGPLYFQEYCKRSFHFIDKEKSSFELFSPARYARDLHNGLLWTPFDLGRSNSLE